MNPTSAYPASASTQDSPLDRLIIGGKLRSRKITLLLGENRTRGALLGRISIGAGVSAAKAGGNTGNGTLTLDAVTPIRVGAKVGVYTVRCIVAAANNGTFRVEDPDGNVLGDIVMAAGAGAFDDDLKFALADGAADFIVGDGFDITVAAGSGKYKLSVAAAVDGSQVPDLVLSEDCDATAADKTAMAYESGEFESTAITFGAGHTAASVREGLRLKNIHLITPAVLA